MSMTGLSSGEGSIGVRYNYHRGEGGCDSSIAISNGELMEEYIESDFEEGGEEGVPYNYLILGAESNPQFRGIRASRVFLEGMSYDPDEESIPLNVTFEGGGSSHPTDLERMLNSKFDGKHLQILYRPRLDERGKGIWNIDAPARFESYAVSLRQLTSSEPD